MLTRRDAVAIVNNLKNGTPPPREHVLLLNVGREREIDYFAKKLDELAEVGTSDVKFVSAQIGAGKTHFLTILSSLALERRFVVSKVDLDTRTTRFDHFEEVYSKLIDGIVTPEEQNDGLSHILEEWARSKSAAHSGFVPHLQTRYPPSSTSEAVIASSKPRSSGFMQRPQGSRPGRSRQR